MTSKLCEMILSSGLSDGTEIHLFAEMLAMQIPHPYNPVHDKTQVSRAAKSSNKNANIIPKASHWKIVFPSRKFILHLKSS
jgi:hypothetical protein